MEISDELVYATRKWLGKDGIELFKDIKNKYGEISACWMDGPIPHPVHFREGMQVRNFLRMTNLCKEWSDHDLDSNWTKVIEKAIS